MSRVNLLVITVVANDVEPIGRLHTQRSHNYVEVLQRLHPVDSRKTATRRQTHRSLLQCCTEDDSAACQSPLGFQARNTQQQHATTNRDNCWRRQFQQKHGTIARDDNSRSKKLSARRCTESRADRRSQNSRHTS